MNIEPIVFIELVFTIFVLASTIVIIVIYFSKLIKKLHLYQTELEQLKSEIGKKQRDLLDDARDRAVKIIDEANNKSLDIVQKANLFTNTAQNNFDNQLKDFTSMQIKAFEKSTSEFINLYDDVLNDLKSKNIEVLQNVSKNIETSTLEEVKKFKKIIEEETISSQKTLKQKIEQEYLIIKKDIDSHKKEEIKMIDDNIYQILEKVSVLVLGKAITLSKHEDLILEALEKTKKEGIFNDGE